MLKRILSWAKKEENVRAVMLIGSRAKEEAVHELSDYDVVLFVEAPLFYLKEDSWISSFGKPWVVVREKTKKFGKILHTRLVLFEGGVKVDWTIASSSLLELWTLKGVGFSLLLDKDRRLEQKKPVQKTVLKPTQKAFSTVVEEFWFEVYHVAVSLKRDDLWSAFFRLGLIRDHFLLPMIEWRYMSERGWKKRPPHNGKSMSSWVDVQTWNEVKALFPHCEKKECEEALGKVIVLFRRLGTETAKSLGFSYLTQLDHEVALFLKKILS